MPFNSFDILQKLTIIGEENTGKSSLLLKYADDTFSPSYIPTIGVDFKVKTIEVDGRRVKLQMWDTAGQVRFRTITHSYYRGSMGCLFVFDITNRESFVGLQHMIEEMVNYGRPELPSILVGNKCDLELDRVISVEEAEDFGARYGMQYMEVSAKGNVNINEVFHRLSYMALHNIQSNLRGTWREQYVIVTPEMWTEDAIYDSAALVVTL